MSYSPNDTRMTLHELNDTPPAIRRRLPPTPPSRRSRARSPFSGLRLVFNTPPRSQTPSESLIQSHSLIQMPSAPSREYTPPNYFDNNRDLRPTRLSFSSENTPESLSGSVMSLPSIVDDIFNMEYKQPIQKYNYRMKPVDEADIPVVFVYNNIMNVLSLSALKELTTDPTSIVYECRRDVPDSALEVRIPDVLFNEPYVHLIRFGLSTGIDSLIKLSEVSDLVRSMMKKKIISDTKRKRGRPPTSKPVIYKLVKTNKTIDRFASKNMVYYQDNVSSFHCQAGNPLDVFTLKKVKKKAKTKKRKANTANNKVKSVTNGTSRKKKKKT